jgi:hypothetical protein
VVVDAQRLPAPEIRLAMGLVQAADQFDAALLEHRERRPVRGQAISQEDVAAAPHANEVIAPTRAIGKPRPGFWL